jgi:hypothetical protein
VDKKRLKAVAKEISEKRGLPEKECYRLLVFANRRIGIMLRKRNFTFDIPGIASVKLTVKGKHQAKLHRREKMKKGPDYKSRMY